MRILSIALLAAGYEARYPNLPQPGTVESILAGAAGTVESIQAGAVRGFSSAGQLQWVKADMHFCVAGEPVYEGDFVQVGETDAKDLERSGRASFATDEEVAEAQKPAKGKS